MGVIKLTNEYDMSAIISKVDESSNVIVKVVNEIIQPYCKDLDEYIQFIRSILSDGQNPPTNEELDDFCLNLSTMIYTAGSFCEILGIKDDISKAIYREVYNTNRDSATGTVADKDAVAEMGSQTERMTNVCYSRAYKIMKSKVENAQELLGSVKKVLSRRMSELELTHFQRN